ncbi:MAG: response regulator [Deinococcus sp.]|nr:response regulator [Deinococcus sp.]
MKPQILVVEDEAVVRDLITEQLEEAGYRVLSAANGKEALSVLTWMVPDLILSDILMPEMDGYVLYKEVRSRPKLRTVPFIFLTALGEAPDVRLAKKKGVDDYLTKPFDHEDLLVAVEARIKRSDEVRKAIYADAVAGIGEGKVEPAPEAPPLHVTPGLLICAFGQARVIHDGKEITSATWASVKAKEMLVYFLEHPEGVHREKVVEDLWGETTVGKGSSVFHTTLHRLRRAVPVVDVSREGMRYYATGRYWYDVSEFRTLLDQAREAKDLIQRSMYLSKAAELYRGSFLEDTYSDWCITSRENLEEAYIGVLVGLAHTSLEQGDHDRGIGHARTILARDPYREEAHRIIMHAHYHMGNRVAALKHYENYAALLAEELGIEPMPETMQAYKDIRAAAGH